MTVKLHENIVQLIFRDKTVLAVVHGTVSQARPILARLRHEHYNKQRDQYRKFNSGNLDRQEYCDLFSWRTETWTMIDGKETSCKKKVASLPPAVKKTFLKSLKSVLKKEKS
jgi:hypothetical protein